MAEKSEHLFTAGHTACSGCGQAIAARLVSGYCRQEYYDCQ